MTVKTKNQKKCRDDRDREEMVEYGFMILSLGVFIFSFFI